MDKKNEQDKDWFCPDALRKDDQMNDEKILFSQEQRNIKVKMTRQKVQCATTFCGGWTGAIVEVDETPAQKAATSQQNSNKKAGKLNKVFTESNSDILSPISHVKDQKLDTEDLDGNQDEVDKPPKVSVVLLDDSSNQNQAVSRARRQESSRNSFVGAGLNIDRHENSP